MSTFGACPYCGNVKPSENGTGKDVACCGEVGHAKVIETEHVYPPIPWRGFDWSAIVPGEYDGAPDSNSPIGRGPTEEAAIADLLEKIEERAWSNVAQFPRPQPCHHCDQPYSGSVCPTCKEERPAYTALKRIAAKTHHGIAALRDPQKCRYYPDSICGCDGRGHCIGEAA